MNIQIFGTKKCFDTKKAQRYFKERGIRFQMIDLKEKEMSRGEFDNVKINVVPQSFKLRGQLNVRFGASCFSYVV